MKIVTHILFLMTFLTSGCFIVNAERNNITAQQLRSIIVENPDSVLSILDMLESEGSESLQPYEINLLKGIAYNEKRMFSLVERYAKETLQSDSIDSHLKEKLNALTLLSTAQTFFGNFQGSINTSLKGIEIARETGNLPGELNILSTMAKTAFAMGDRKQGYGYLDQAISTGESSDDIRVLANVSSAYGIKVVELYADDRFEEGLKEGYKRLGIIDRIDRLGGAPEGFTDQQRAYSYARIASCAQRLNKLDEAKKAYNSFIATDFAKHPMGKAYIIDYLLDSNQWNKVVEFTSPLFPILAQGDTINDDFRSLLISNARAYAGLGEFRKAYGLSDRAALIKDSLQLRENTAQARELATVFALNEKELELANAKAALQQRHLLMIASFGIALLVAIIAWLLFRAYRLSRKQQKISTQRIDELLSMNRISPENLESDSDSLRKFISMQQSLLNSDLFSNPTFNRENIMECSGLTRSMVINLIEKYTGLTPSDYINKLRVEHSVVLIQEHPDWTIDAIAEACGYKRRATYYSHFSKIFGITPAQYRKEKGKDKSVPI
ncbi:MAG: AraC family transcriptional regulator [Bacteroides sp.]|nr:AraC family transcriptional regulator [Bacteroides sp.]